MRGGGARHWRKILHGCMNVVHVFPYSVRISGGHSNAIRCFIACQRAAGLNAVGIAPEGEAGPGEPTREFPLVEVESLWALRWAGIAERLAITPGNSVANLHSVNRRQAALLGDLRRAGVPYVFTSHGQLGYQTAWRWLKKFVYLNFVHRGPRKAAGLHLLTAAADRRLRLLLPGYRGLRLIQGNVVQAPDPAELPAGSRSDYGIPQDTFLLAFMGRLDVWVKGLDLLVEAFSRLPPERFRLVMAGPDWEGGKTKLEHLAERFGCGNRIHFIGPVYGAKKWSLLRMADMFVSPSRREAFSIALAEAMTVGLPVLTSTTVSLAEELREADAALLAPPAAEPLGRAIATLAADPQRRRALGIRAKAWAEKNCDPGRAGAPFREFYQAILAKARGAGR